MGPEDEPVDDRGGQARVGEGLAVGLRYPVRVAAGEGQEGMAKRGTSNYRPASAARNTRSGSPAKGRLRLARPRLRRDIILVGGLALAVVVAAATLGGALFLAKENADWASVASVNGHSIDRQALRGRVAVLSFLADQRAAFIQSTVSGSYFTPDELSGLEAAASAPLADIVTAARESLIDDELMRQLAARQGVTTPAAPDPWSEADAYVTGDLAHQIRVVRFGLPSTASSAASPAPSGSNPWPAAAGGNLAPATARLHTELAAGTPVETIVAGLHDAGWDVSGENVAVSSSGAPADTSLDLDPQIAAALAAVAPDDVVGPATDEYGRVSMALVLAPAVTGAIVHSLPGAGASAKLDTGALADWAAGQALRRALADALLAHWKNGGVTLAHFRELVIGDAPDSSGTAGPWVELSGLDLDRVAGLEASAIVGAPAGLNLAADPLAASLRAMTAADRTRLFGALVRAANAAGGSGTADSSGEIGFATKDGMIPAVGNAAFDPKVKSGDILGPITTTAGPELYLVEARFGGALDERSQAALQQVRADPSPDPLAYTTRFSPVDVALARDAGWRADAEFAPSEDVRSALFNTPLGTLSDPFVLDGKLACAIVDSRTTGVPSARTAARLALDGFDAWYSGQRSAATITRSDNPLPELESPSPSPSPTLALPTIPGLATPALPTIPGLPGATPIKTDSLGLPALP